VGVGRGAFAYLVVSHRISGFGREWFGPGTEGAMGGSVAVADRGNGTIGSQRHMRSALYSLSAI